MIFGVNSLWIWGAVIILSVVVETFTLSLCAIWFAVGGLAALVAASIKLNVLSQLVIFVLFSAALLVLVRPICHRMLRAKNVPTNADRIIGETAVVTEEIDNMRGTGAVKISGKVWTARSADDTAFAPGAPVRIARIEGVKVIVTALDEETDRERK